MKLRQNGTLSIQMENKASSPPAMMIVAWTPQTSTTAPQPMAAKGCTPIVTMLNSPRMADLRSGGARSCSGSGRRGNRAYSTDVFLHDLHQYFGIFFGPA